MPSPPVRADFVECNRRLAAGSIPAPDELAEWARGRDALERLLAAEAERAAARTGTPPRRHPRARLAVRAHLAGHGRAFTADIGFRGVALHPDREAGVRRGDPASVRLELSNRSVYASGRVAWADGGRVGVELEAIAPEDELLLQAVVCERLLAEWPEQGGGSPPLTRPR